MSKSNSDEAAPSRAKAAAGAKSQHKGDKVIALLRRDRGASLEEMVRATGWQKHSVRGFMAGVLKKRHGLTVTSEKTDGGRIYRLATESR